MKSLKIKGVETLIQKELRSIEGGNWGIALGFLALFIQFYNEKEDFYNGFEQGFKNGVEDAK